MPWLVGLTCFSRYPDCWQVYERGKTRREGEKKRQVVVAITVLFGYGLADQLARLLGRTAMTIIVRLSSLLLVCIGVKIMWNGISAPPSSLRT